MILSETAVFHCQVLFGCPCCSRSLLQGLRSTQSKAMGENDVRERASSSVSLRPYGTSQRLRSRSLIQGGVGEEDRARITQVSIVSTSTSTTAITATTLTTKSSNISSERGDRSSNAELPSTPTDTFSPTQSFGFSDDEDSRDSGPSSSSLPPPRTPIENIHFPMSHIKLPHQLLSIVHPSTTYPPQHLDPIHHSSYLAPTVPSTVLPFAISSTELPDANDGPARHSSPLGLLKDGNNFSTSSSSGLPAQPMPLISLISVHDPTIRSTTSLRSHPLSRLLPPLLFLCVLFTLSLFCVYLAINTIPLQLPHTISEIRQQTVALREYSRRGWWEGMHVSAVLSVLFIFKQAFSVPGSILVNILFGSLYGTVSYFLLWVANRQSQYY